MKYSGHFFEPLIFTKSINTIIQKLDWPKVNHLSFDGQKKCNLVVLSLITKGSIF